MLDRPKTITTSESGDPYATGRRVRVIAVRDLVEGVVTSTVGDKVKVQYPRGGSEGQFWTQDFTRAQMDEFAARAAQEGLGGFYFDGQAVKIAPHDGDALVDAKIIELAGDKVKVQYPRGRDGIWTQDFTRAQMDEFAARAAGGRTEKSTP